MSVDVEVERLGIVVDGLLAPGVDRFSGRRGRGGAFVKDAVQAQIRSGPGHVWDSTLHGPHAGLSTLGIGLLIGHAGRSVGRRRHRAKAWSPTARALGSVIPACTPSETLARAGFAEFVVEIKMNVGPQLPAVVSTERALDLTRRLFPVTFPRELADVYRLSAGLTARCATTAEAAVHLSQLGRSIDVMVCARSLFEHAVTLAWLLGPEEPAERFLLWQRHCDEQTLRMDDEVARLTGDPPRIDANARAEIEASFAELGRRRMPNLADRTLVADREWAGELGFDPAGKKPWSLRRLYSIVYRVGSMLAHPTLTGVALVTSRTERGDEVAFETPGRAADGMFPVPFALGVALGVMSVRFDVPARPALNEFIGSLIDSMNTDADWTAPPRRS